MDNQQRSTVSRRLAPQLLLSMLALTVVNVVLARYALPHWGTGWTAVCMIAAGVLLAAWWLSRVRTEIGLPLEQLRLTLLRASAKEEDGPGPALLERHDELGALAGAVVQVNRRSDEQLQKACSAAAREAETKARRGMAEEICRSALPQVLPDIPSRSHFEVDGLIERGRGRDCQFYDYFFIDPGLLCVVLAQTPGGGVAEALYMVVAQATIRSRLRQGRSLEETMADVNAQLYDLGSQFCLNALVATLSTADGRFTYVNAGQQQPLLMRNEDRYEWLDSPVYAPLGMNENISYRAIELKLKQGDRLFLHTAGMSQLTGVAKAAYGVQQMRADLNISRSKDLSDGGLLPFMRDRALTYCGDQEHADQPVNNGFAMLSLLFCKGNKELAHCDVPARPEYAGTVTAFLKKQFEDNGISKRHYARQTVVVDEVFALCCHKAVPDTRVMVECGVAPDAQMVNIRVAAALRGVDPIEGEHTGNVENAIAFIRENADYITFTSGNERDTITIVCFLE